MWLGSVDRECGACQQISISDVTIHPNYEVYYLGDDIALFTLATPVTFTDYIRPICLADETDVFPASSICYATGWGHTDYASTSKQFFLVNRLYTLHGAHNMCRINAILSGVHTVLQFKFIFKILQLMRMTACT